MLRPNQWLRKKPINKFLFSLQKEINLVSQSSPFASAGMTISKKLFLSIPDDCLNLPIALLNLIELSILSLLMPEYSF
ncbi:Uncharacterised protein [Proteus mirabilis]|uniref:Uncharacterized protein n=1 Tax=Proteus mirabilis TaxID=584 RepID=A0A2X2DIT4_PROMI|nr:Uncharacterised protein [Proteus mirabilis]